MSKKAKRTKKAAKRELNPIRDYIEAKAAYDEAKRAYDAAKATLFDCFILKNADSISCGEHTAKLVITTQNRFDSNAFRNDKEYGHLYGQFRRPVTCTRIEAQ